VALAALIAHDSAHNLPDPQSPAHQKQFAEGFLGMLADYWDRLGWCNVVPRTPIVFFTGDGLEVFLDKLLSPTQFVATAHRKIIADWIASRLWGCGQTAFPAPEVPYRFRSFPVDLPALVIIRSDRFGYLDCFGTPAESNPKM
jgi:hypothetical protein